MADELFMVKGPDGTQYLGSLSAQEKSTIWAFMGQRHPSGIRKPYVDEKGAKIKGDPGWWDWKPDYEKKGYRVVKVRLVEEEAGS